MAKKKNLYFTKVHEDAIIRYAQTTCIKERTDLYINYIAPAFNEMVDKIVFTYKFTNLPNIDYLRDECKIWLMTILDKYDSTKSTSARLLSRLTVGKLINLSINSFAADMIG